MLWPQPVDEDTGVMYGRPQARTLKGLDKGQGPTWDRRTRLSWPRWLVAKTGTLGPHPDRGVGGVHALQTVHLSLTWALALPWADPHGILKSSYLG